MKDIKDLIPAENRLLWSQESIELPKRAHRKHYKKIEAGIQKAILRYLEFHSKVAWAHRMNTGAVKYTARNGRDRFIRYGFTGCSDIIGQLKDGRFLAIECKAERGQASEAQDDFIALVNNNGGIAGIAKCIEDVSRLLS